MKFNNYKGWSVALVIVLLCPLTQSVARAQDEVVVKEKPTAFSAERKVMLTCLSAGDAVPSVYYRTLSTEAERAKGAAAVVVQSTTVPFSMRSPEPTAYVGPTRLEVFDEEPPAGPPFNADGERQGPQPVAVAQLPSGQPTVLLLFVPIAIEHQKGNLKFRVVVYDDSKNTLPFGSYRIINFTNRELIACAGSRKASFKVNPGQPSKTIQPGGDKRNLLWEIFDAREGAEKPLYSSKWTHRPNYRTMVFVTDSRTQRGGLTVKPIAEWKE